MTVNSSQAWESNIFEDCNQLLVHYKNSYQLNITYKQRKLTPGSENAESDEYLRLVSGFVAEWRSGKELFTLHTSGSTGAPKLIEVTRSQMEASARATLAFLDLSQSSPVTLCIDARYVGGKMQIVRALIANMPLQIIPPAREIARDLDAYPALGLLALVPLQLYEILQKAPRILNNAQAVLIGGAPVSADVLPQLQRLTAPVFQTYGMTETVSHIALRRLNGKAPSLDYETLPGVKISLDGRGCLVVEGEVTANTPVVTNDMVELVNSRSFRWLGRIDEVVNSGGVKLFPEEIDGKIAGHLQGLIGPCQYFTYGLPDPELGQKLVLFVETAAKEAVPGEIIAILKKELPPYHAPKEVIKVTTFAKTPSGKIDKRKTVFSVLS